LNSTLIRSLAVSSLLFVGCTLQRTQVKQLGPAAESGPAPAVCMLAGVLPESPASKVGLHAGDQIISVNGKRPETALAVSELVDQSPNQAILEVKDPAGASRTLHVNLNKDKPRLGLSCDLTGWSKNSVSAAGNESITLFSGPYALTASGIIDKGVAFMRVRLSNHSDRDLSVSREMFAVEDGGHNAQKLLTAQEVMYFMHGPDGVPLVKSPDPKIQLEPVPDDSVVRKASQSHKRKSDWSRSDEVYVRSNADYLNKETLWPTQVAPGKTADGLIYFLEPKTLPVILTAKINDRTMTATFGKPQPAAQRMSADDLIKFFESQKKGTPLRLTLKNGKVFVGRYASYDADNEMVWFDTPSGVLLTTSSFGLKHIAFAEVMSPEPAQKQPASQPLN
jgi:hypothetical protein